MQSNEKVSTKKVIAGFPGVGKSTAAKLHPDIFIDLESSDYHSTLDFRTLVYLDEKIYFRTDDYFLLPDADIYYANGYYYCNVDDIPNIENIIEFGGKAE